MNLKINNEKALNLIYDRSRTGVETINQILKKTNDSTLTNELTQQKQQLTDVGSEAVMLLGQYGKMPEDANFFDKMQQKFLVGLSNMTNTKTSHLADIIKEEHNISLNSLQKELKNDLQLDANVKNVMDKMISTLNGFNGSLTNFL